MIPCTLLYLSVLETTEVSLMLKCLTMQQSADTTCMFAHFVVYMASLAFIF